MKKALNKKQNKIKKLAQISAAVFMLFLFLFPWENISSASSVSKKINYQGRLKDGSGTDVADGVVSMVFKIYDSSESNVWTESWTNAALWTETSTTTFTRDSSTCGGSGFMKVDYATGTNESSLKAGQTLWNTTIGESSIIRSVSEASNYICAYNPKSTWTDGDDLTNRVYVKDGIFNVLLGSVSDMSVDFSGGEYLLGVQVGSVSDTMDAEMSPRKPLSSVPQAINANNLAGDGIIDLDNTSTTSDGANINYNPASGSYSGLEITHGANGTGGALKVIQSGTGEIAGFYDGSTEVFKISDGGLVGIGTTSPTNILSFGGTAARTIWMERNTTAATAGQGLTLHSGGAYVGGTDLNGGNLTLSSGIATGAGTSNIYFNTATAGLTGTTDNTPSTKMTILGSGNVGIGTMSPSERLEISGGVLKIGSGDGYNAAIIKDGNGNVSFRSIRANAYWSDGPVNTTAFQVGADGDNIVFTTATSGIAPRFMAHTNGFQVNGGAYNAASAPAGLFEVTNGATKIFDVLSTGNVGIGTTSPSELLSLQQAGTAKANTNMLSITNSGNAADMDGTISSILFNQYYYDASTPALVDSGNISVGTETDWTSTASTQDAYMAFSTVFDGSMTEHMRITSAGNVGIGTTNPDNVLHVHKATAGTVAADANSILTLENDTTAYLSFLTPATATSGILFGDTGDNGRASVLYNHNIDSLSIEVAGATAQTIDSSGNVGIGTTSPAGKLTIGTAPSASHTGGTGLDISSAFNTDVNWGQIALYSTDAIAANKGGKIVFGGTYNGTSDTTWAGVGGFKENSTSGQYGGYINFWTRAYGSDMAERVRITSSGNVGIGTTSPTAYLQLKAGTATASTAPLKFTAGTNLTAAEAGAMEWDGTSLYMTQTSGPTRKTIAYTDSAMTGTFDGINLATGNQGGISYFSSTTQLASSAAGTAGQTLVSGGTGAPTWFAPTAGSLIFAGTSGVLSQNNSNLFWDDSNNRLGIGTTTPSTMLDIYGTSNKLRLSYDGSNYSSLSSNSSGVLEVTNSSASDSAVIVGDGTSAVDISLQFDETSQDYYFGVDNTDHYLKIGMGSVVGTSSLLTFSTAGLVGIGTTSPSQMLTIGNGTDQGNVYIAKGYICVDNNGTCAIASPAAGRVYAVGAYTTGADYAEYFFTNDTDLKSGEAVCVDVTQEKGVKRCTNDGDNNIMGIVSSNPSIVGNHSEEQEQDPDHYKIIGMIGQVAGLVSAENGEIKIGDSLTASAIPGYMRKSNAGESTVGLAMENFKGTKGQIKILISRRNQSLTVEKVEETVLENIKNMNVEDQVNNIVAQAKETLDSQIENTNQSLLDIQNSLTQTNSEVASILALQIKIQQQMDLIEELATANSTFVASLFDEFGNLNLGEGKLEAVEVTAGVFAVKVVDKDDSTIGEGIICPEMLEVDESGKCTVKQTDKDNDDIDDKTGNPISNGKSVKIKTNAISDDSKVFVTAKDVTDATLAVTDIDEGEGFTVEIKEKTSEAIKFDWWIVEKK